MSTSLSYQHEHEQNVNRDVSGHVHASPISIADNRDNIADR